MGQQYRKANRHGAVKTHNKEALSAPMVVIPKWNLLFLLSSP